VVGGPRRPSRGRPPTIAGTAGRNLSGGVAPTQPGRAGPRAGSRCWADMDTNGILCEGAGGRSATAGAQPQQLWNESPASVGQ
jgi:hypothetical protein